MSSVPNQSNITIHKPKYEGDFVQVSIAEWQTAFTKLPAKISFGMYLYLCGNQDGFPLALSSADVQNRLRISDSSYRRAVEDLKASGYLIERNGNPRTLDFYTTPQPTTYVKKESKKKNTTGGGATGAASVSIEEAPYEPPAYDEPSRVIYRSSSGYGWEEN